MKHENEKMITRKVRTVKKRPQDVRDKISKGMRAYWQSVTLIDEDGNVINRDKDKSEGDKQ